MLVLTKSLTLINGFKALGFIFMTAFCQTESCLITLSKNTILLSQMPGGEGDSEKMQIEGSIIIEYNGCVAC